MVVRARRERRRVVCDIVGMGLGLFGMSDGEALSEGEVSGDAEGCIVAVCVGYGGDVGWCVESSSRRPGGTGSLGSTW